MISANSGIFMNSNKKLRIIVFEDDLDIMALLKDSLSAIGHHVLTFSDPTACSVFNNQDKKCPQQLPCADVVISDIMMPKVTGIDLFKLMRTRGCKALDKNKALMSADLKPEQIRDIQELGCHFIKKPFKLAEIIRWLEECAERVQEGRALADLS